MGSWGPGIFANDTAADIRGEYRDYLEDQLPDEEAMRLVIESVGYLRESGANELWIALAAAQTQGGRLDPAVRTAAIAAIDDGAGLELWTAAGRTELAKRVAALQKLRDHLTAPQLASRSS